MCVELKLLNIIVLTQIKLMNLASGASSSHKTLKVILPFESTIYNDETEFTMKLLLIKWVVNTGKYRKQSNSWL